MRLSLAMLLCALVIACNTARGPVGLEGAWPNEPGDYESVTASWTRHGRVLASATANADRILDVYATFKAPHWRAAYARFAAKSRNMPKAEAAALLATEREKAEQGHEVELLVATYDRRANDLQKNLRSTWRVSLADDQGNEIRASTIRRDRRPRSEIQAEFEHLGDFHVAYIAIFPKSIEVLRPDAKKFTVRIASSRGGVDLVWEHGK